MKVACETCDRDMRGRYVEIETPPLGAERILSAEDASQEGPIFCGQDCLPNGIVQMTKRIIAW